MPSAQVLGDELRKLRIEQDALFAKFTKAAGDDGKPVIDMPAEAVAEARSRNEAIGTKAQEYEQALEVEGWAVSNADALTGFQPRGRTRDADPSEQDPNGRPATKTLGELFLESPAYRGWKAGMSEGPVADIDLQKHFGKSVAARGVKALFDSATGWAPQAIRLPEPIVPGSEVRSIASLMPEGRTAQNAIPYMEETTTTSGAAERAETAAATESALALEEKTSPVREIATSLPVTDIALEDEPMVESYIDTRLRTFVTLRENLQLISGNGGGVNLRGILNVVGVQTQAKGADPTPDAVYKAMTKVRVGSYFEPTAGVFHPNDWQDIRLLRTADGIYIFGSPSDAGPERIWGIDAVQTTQMTENTALVGAFRAGAQVFRRSTLSLQIGWVNDQFVKRQRTILVTERLALVVFRPAAFCMVTGI
jgi:HK97 family phage major capsid protein